MEKHVAPDTIIATKYEGNDIEHHPILKRPLCPYPAAAHYKGKGDTDDAASFICTTK